jgi:hypothetical protein
MYPIPPWRAALVGLAPVLIWRASSGAPPQTPEFSALVPGWPCCEHEASPHAYATPDANFVRDIPTDSVD